MQYPPLYETWRHYSFLSFFSRDKPNLELSTGMQMDIWFFDFFNSKKKKKNGAHFDFDNYTELDFESET